MIRNLRRTVTFSAAVGLATALACTGLAAQAATPASGMENVAPVRPANQAMAQPGQFILNADRDVELVRFSKPHDTLVCVPAKMDINGRPDLAGSMQYPVIVSWDGNAGEIWPGNCLAFDATSAKVSPSPDMPSTGHVEGQVYLF